MYKGADKRGILGSRNDVTPHCCTRINRPLEALKAQILNKVRNVYRRAIPKNLTALRPR